MKKQPCQDRDLQGEGETHHPFEDDEFGIDPRKAIFLASRLSARIAQPSLSRKLLPVARLQDCNITPVDKAPQASKEGLRALSSFEMPRVRGSSG
jgi:hypothetical protein